MGIEKISQQLQQTESTNEQLEQELQGPQLAKQLLEQRYQNFLESREGQSTSELARTLTAGTITGLEIPTEQLLPHLGDNEDNGVVLYWVGSNTAIQIELDGDGTHFIRIDDRQNRKTLHEEEASGPVNLEPVNRALAEWAANSK